MTNHERYRRAAEFVRPSRKIHITHDTIHDMEMKIMKGNKYPVRKILAGVCASLALILLLSSGAYAVNLGGFQRTVNIWLHGDLTEVRIEQVGEGHFQVTYSDGTVRGTGGMAEDGHGGMRGLTMDEIKENLLNSAEVEQDEDGRIWLYLRAHKIDITDEITEKGYAQEKIKDGILADYVTVRWYEDGYSIATGKFGFPDPENPE